MTMFPLSDPTRGQEGFAGVSISIVDNVSRDLASVINPLLAQSAEVRVAVAFISQEGLRSIMPALRQCLASNGRIEFLVGLDLATTEPAALWNLAELSESNLRFSWHCLLDLTGSGIFHPKLYVMEAAESVTAIIGSSNLTAGGLSKNVEVNVVLHALPTEEIISDIREVYAALKFHPHRVTPDDELLSLYQGLCSISRRKREEMRGDKEAQSLRSALRQKMSTLSRPIPTLKDLSGWQRLVFENLPGGGFTTRDLYRLEEIFAARYPSNRNVKAKIRQVLQQLRDMGLLRHIARATWRRGDIELPST